MLINFLVKPATVAASSNEEKELKELLDWAN